jgi:ribosome-binding protein aMBF1 (putative translation factor)
MGSHSSRRPTPSPKSDPDAAKRRHAARREAREAAGLTIEELAKKLGYSPAYIERIERLGNAPRFLAGVWSETLGCKISLFL